MCFSAQVRESYLKYLRQGGAYISIMDFVYALERDLDMPRSVVDELLELEGDGPLGALIRARHAALATEYERLLFQQRTRLTEAERKLATKPTKAAAESRRIATNKIEWARDKLADLQRNERKPSDGRFFPGWYAPVLVLDEDGRRVARPMRYLCRPAGMPVSVDRDYSGAYNARRDNLDGRYWSKLFGVRHGVLVVDRFFENVDRGGKKVVLEFTPETSAPMMVACLWSHWTPWPGSDEPELLSFAAITDEPPPEVAAAGHDRCIVPLKPENVDAWLRGGPVADMLALLDDRERPYYEHRLAA